MRKRVLSIIFSVLLLLTMLLPTSLAASAAGDGSINLNFRHENQPMSSVTFRLHLIATLQENGFEWTEDFSGYFLNLNLGEDAGGDDWKTLASTLAAYAARDGIAPAASGQTDEKGMLRFSGLEPGLYLVTGQSFTRDGVFFSPQPMLVSVPYVDDDGTPQNDVFTEPKYEFRVLTGDTIERRALKVWEDNGYQNQRPQEVVVQLLCDGQIYDEQTLNSANNWRHTWSGLDAAHDWQLVEKTVPAHYTVKVGREGVTFVVTNTYDSPPPSSTPSNPPPSTPSSKPPKLPQTGLLWWPVPVLLGVGVVLLVVGAVVVCRKQDHKDA